MSKQERAPRLVVGNSSPSLAAKITALCMVHDLPKNRIASGTRIKEAGGRNVKHLILFNTRRYRRTSKTQLTISSCIVVKIGQSGDVSLTSSFSTSPPTAELRTRWRMSTVSRDHSKVEIWQHNHSSTCQANWYNKF